MDELLAKGDCKDYGEVIACAVANPAALHGKAPTNGSIVIDGEKEEVAEASQSAGNGVKVGGKLQVPEMFGIEGLDKLNPMVAKGVNLVRPNAARGYRLGSFLGNEPMAGSS